MLHGDLGLLPPDEARSADDTSKLNKPQAHFEKAGDVAADEDLSRSEKKKALETWEQDARQLLIASNEGLPGKDEGASPEDAPKLGEVVRAKAGIGEKPKPKSAKIDPGPPGGLPRPRSSCRACEAPVGERAAGRLLGPAGCLPAARATQLALGSGVDQSWPRSGMGVPGPFCGACAVR